MSILDNILKKMSGAPDDVDNLARKVGIEPEKAEQAIAALGLGHQMTGDTVEFAASKTGLSHGTLSQIVDEIGGEGSLTEFAMALDRDRDGHVLDDLMDSAKALFTKE